MIISTDNTDNNYSLTIMLPVSSVFIGIGVQIRQIEV